MDQNNTPTEPNATPADSSAAAEAAISDAARIAAVADAEAANAVRAAEAAMARAVSARAALAHADAARAAALNAAAAQASAEQAAAVHAAAVRASMSDTPAGATSDVVAAPSAAAVASFTPATQAPAAHTPDAMTTQKVFYNSTPYGAASAGAGAGADVPPETPVAGKTSAFRGRTVGLLVGGAAAIAIALGGGGYAIGSAIATSNTSTSSAITTPDTTTPDTTTPDSGEYLPTMPFGGTDQGTQSPGTGSSTDTSTDATAATAEQTEGVVTIVSTLYYDETTQAAGTGVILTSDGQILTNNHVIEGSTSIEVTVESTGETYSATVVGTDATNDIALLQLDDASGLDVSTTDDGTLAIGDEATSIGNAEGTGDLVAAAGTITALNESITVGNEYTGAEESLNGLIEIDADVVSGDSGGPLVDSDGDVVGIVTAASSGSTNITGYAIPIETALDIVDQIQSGEETDTVQIGLPAFLGVQLATTQQSLGVAVGGVIAGTPAATAGLAAGDVITAVDGTSVATAEALSDLIATYDAGDSVTINYTDAAGAAQQATVTLMEGPAA